MNFDKLPNQEGESNRLIPIYNPEDQIGITKNITKDNSYNDLGLYTVSCERTRALRNMDPERGSISVATGGEGLLWAIDHIDPEVGRAFDAHGIALKTDPVEALDKILKNGFDENKTLYTTGFSRQTEAGPAIGADHPFTEGGIVLVSEQGRKLLEGIKYVVVGEEYSRVIDIMRERYPEVVIVPWHDAPRVLTLAYNEANKRNIPCEDFNAKNRPIYSAIISQQKNTKEEFDIPQPSSKNEDVW